MTVHILNDRLRSCISNTDGCIQCVVIDSFLQGNTEMQRRLSQIIMHVLMEIFILFQVGTYKINCIIFIKVFFFTFMMGFKNSKYT